VVKRYLAEGGVSFLPRLLNPVDTAAVLESDLQIVIGALWLANAAFARAGIF
jgi:hypothetical protein